jgi:hypothetical protein
MNNYDHDVLGVGNSQHPANQKEVAPEPIHTWANLTESYESGHESVFKEKQAEILEDASFLLYALESVESGLTGKLKSIIEKLQ